MGIFRKQIPKPQLKYKKLPQHIKYLWIHNFENPNCTTQSKTSVYQ